MLHCRASHRYLLCYGRTWTAGHAAAPSAPAADDTAAPSPVAASLLSEALQRSSLNEAPAQHEEGHDEKEENQPAAEVGQTEEPAGEGPAVDQEAAAAQQAAPTTQGGDVTAAIGGEETQAADAAPVPAETAEEDNADEPVSSVMMRLQRLIVMILQRARLSVHQSDMITHAMLRCRKTCAGEDRAREKQC